MPICAVKWSRRRQALVVEASRTVGDALMQLPRHCRVSPLLLPHKTPTPPPPPPHTGQRAHDGALSSAAPWSQARSRLPGNRGAVEESSLVLFISAEPRGICHRHRVHFFTSLIAALLCGVLEVAKTKSIKGSLNATTCTITNTNFKPVTNFSLHMKLMILINFLI